MTYPTATPLKVDRPADLPSLLADACRVVRRSASGLSAKERQLLQDYRKARYAMTTLDQLLVISASCTELEGLFAIPEACRAYTIGVLARRLRGAPSVFEAFRRETEAQTAADLAQLRFAFDRTAVARDEALERLVAQETATRAAIDALHHHRATSSKSLVLMR